MYGKILVPVDGSGPSMLGLAEAIKVAQSNKSTLRLIHVVSTRLLIGEDPPTVDLTALTEAARASGAEILEQAKAVAARQGITPEVQMMETAGSRAADLIVEHARKWPADLIVMGTHGRRGLRRLAMGSDAELVLRSTPVPILLVRGDEA